MTNNPLKVKARFPEDEITVRPDIWYTDRILFSHYMRVHINIGICTYVF